MLHEDSPVCEPTLAQEILSERVRGKSYFILVIDLSERELSFTVIKFRSLTAGLMHFACILPPPCFKWIWMNENDSPKNGQDSKESITRRGWMKQQTLAQGRRVEGSHISRSDVPAGVGCQGVPITEITEFGLQMLPKWGRLPHTGNHKDMEDFFIYYLLFLFFFFFVFLGHTRGIWRFPG